MLARRVIANLCVVALAMASFAFICTLRGAPTMDMGERMQVHPIMLGCMGDSPSCPGQHMRSFAEAVPAVPIDDLAMVLGVLIVLACAISAAGLKKDEVFLLQAGIAEQLKIRRPFHEHRPLALAFSRGVIHSKRYA